MGAREEGGGVGSEWEIGGLEAGVRSGCRLRVVADGYMESKCELGKQLSENTKLI